LDVTLGCGKFWGTSAFAVAPVVALLLPARRLLDHLYDLRRRADLRFRDEQVNMFRHNNVSHNHESVSLAHLLEDGKEAVAATRPLQKWQSAITGTSDKVQVVRAIGAMQAAAHGKAHGIGNIMPSYRTRAG
jgi:hypothetical protein